MTPLGTGPDGRITKKDVETFVPPKVAPVSRLKAIKDGYAEQSSGRIYHFRNFIAVCISITYQNHSSITLNQ